MSIRIKILAAITIMLSCMIAHGQAVRVDPINVMTTGSQPPSGNPGLFAVPFANVTLCGYPANAKPCTNFATTYTDQTEAIACPQTSQVVLNGTTACSPITDGGGSFGFWVAPGNYTYMIQDSQGNSYGPYFLSAPASTLASLCPLTGCTFTGPINLPAGTPTGQQAVSAAALAAYNYLQPSGSTFSNLNSIYSVSTTIAAAVTAAGRTGSVLIPAAYTGTDSFTNLYNIGFIDYRSHNPLNLIQQTNPVPQNILYATDYGVLADGFHDDTANLQAAANALRARCGGTGGSTTFMCPAVLELPQGRIEISAPIVFADYGSVHCNGTWILPLEPWLGTSGDLFQITTSYFPRNAYGSPGNHGISISTINRFVDGCNFEYNYNATVHDAIHVFSGYGHSSSQPYPSSDAQSLDYQLKQVTLKNNSVYAMDTGFVIEDCGECLITNNQINDVKWGILHQGNVYGTTYQANAIQAGSWSFTTSANHTQTYGFYGTLETLWTCSNSAINCSGGTATQNLTVGFQGLTLLDDNFEQFDTDIYVPFGQGVVLDGGVADYAGYGPYGQANPTVKQASVYFGPTVIQAQIDNYYCANFNTNASPCFEIGPPTQNASDALSSQFQNGAFTISNSTFDKYSGGGTAIQFDQSIYNRKGDKITGNTFINWQFGVLFNGPEIDGVVMNNYGSAFQTGGAMIDFNQSAQPFTGTVVENNTTSSPTYVVYASSGTGWRTGFNQSATQLTGSFTATGTGVSIAGGAVGTLSTAITMTMPAGYAFADNAYTITSCVLQGATGAAHITLVGGSAALSSFTVYEVTDSTAAVSGGTIACNVSH